MNHRGIVAVIGVICIRAIVVTRTYFSHGTRREHVHDSTTTNNLRTKPYTDHRPRQNSGVELDNVYSNDGIDITSALRPCEARRCDEGVTGDNENSLQHTHTSMTPYGASSHSPWTSRRSSESHYGVNSKIFEVSYNDEFATPKHVLTPKKLESKSVSVAPVVTQETFPILVISFSGTIVICGAIFLFLELRERRKLDQQMITLIQSLSQGGSSLSDRESRSESHRRFYYSSCGGSELNSPRSSFYNHKYQSVPSSREGSIEGTPFDVGATAALMCNNNNSSLSLCCSREKRDEEYCDDDFNKHSEKFSIRDHHDRYPTELIYRSEDGSRSDASTMTTSLPLVEEKKDESSKTTIFELSEIHRVSTDTKLESLVDLGKIPANIALSSSLLVEGEQGNENNNESDNDHGASEDEENGVPPLFFRVLPDSDSTGRRKHSLLKFDAGISSVTEVMVDDDTNNDRNYYIHEHTTSNDNDNDNDNENGTLDRSGKDDMCEKIETNPVSTDNEKKIDKPLNCAASNDAVLCDDSDHLLSSTNDSSIINNESKEKPNTDPTQSYKDIVLSDQGSSVVMGTENSYLTTTMNYTSSPREENTIETNRTYCTAYSNSEGILIPIDASTITSSTQESYILSDENDDEDDDDDDNCVEICYERCNAEEKCRDQSINDNILRLGSSGGIILEYP